MEASKPPYINRPQPVIIKPPKQEVALEDLEQEFMHHSRNMSEMDSSDKLLASIACNAILLDTINHPDWVRHDGA